MDQNQNESKADTDPKPDLKIKTDDTVDPDPGDVELQQSPSTSKKFDADQFSNLLVDHCYDVYRTIFEQGFKKLTVSDDFFEKHTGSLFIALARFSENFTPTYDNVKLLVLFTHKLRMEYNRRKIRFINQQENLGKELIERLDQALKIYDDKMMEKCSGVGPSELDSAHEESSQLAKEHLETIRYKNEGRWEIVDKQLQRSLTLQFDIFQKKNGLELNLDVECFKKLDDALGRYKEEMDKRRNDDNPYEAHHKSLELAKTHLQSVKDKSEARWEYTYGLLERSTNIHLNIKHVPGVEISAAFPHEEISVKMGDDAMLGRGGFGKVYLGRMKSLDLVAIKVPRFTGSTDQINATRKTFLTEVRHMKQASHVNVVRVEGYTTCGERVAMIMEYLPGGSLHDILYLKNKDNQDEFEVPVVPASLRLRFCADICCGVAYLHSGFSDQRLVHGDIKPANILLTSDLRCKIADFGGADFATISEQLSISELKKKKMGHFTRGFVAPEMLSNHDVRLGTAMDVFSVGVTFYFVLRRAYPLSEFDIFKHILKKYAAEQEGSGERDRELMSFMKGYMLRCTDEEGKKRPTMMRVRDDLLRKLRSLDVAQIAREVAKVIEIRPKPKPFLEESDCIKFADLKVD